MTSLLLDAPRLAPAGLCHGGRHAERPGGRGLTLAERLDSLWAGLHADSEAECPICRSRMTLRHGAGECGGCGSKLS
jgi:hypothetical protein